jgi:hypothetical protein
MPPRPGQVRAGGPVAGLAADADLAPAGAVDVLLRVVRLDVAGHVALGAHHVPVLIGTGPVQLIAMIEHVRIELKPALAAARLGAAVPSHRQRLQASARKAHQVLLQRCDAEREGHLVLLAPPAGTFRLHLQRRLIAEKARLHAALGAGGCGRRRLGEHVLGGRLVHRVRVLRGRPRRPFSRVAGTAGLAADEARVGCWRSGNRGRGGLAMRSAGGCCWNRACFVGPPADAGHDDRRAEHEPTSAGPRSFHFAITLRQRSRPPAASTVGERARPRQRPPT